MKNYFKTGKRLQIAIDHPVDTSIEEYLDLNFAYSFFDLDGNRAMEALRGEKFPLPYWLDIDSIIRHLPPNLRHIAKKLSADNVLCEYVEGIHCEYALGDIHEECMYIGSQPLPEEMEHQADDGKLVYEYRGHSFLRLWLDLRE